MPRSSSPTEPLPADAVVTDGDHAGPIRLPAKDADAFILRFNDLYARLNLRISRLPKPARAHEKTPAEDRRGSID